MWILRSHSSGLTQDNIISNLNGHMSAFTGHWTLAFEEYLFLWSEISPVLLPRLPAQETR